MYKLGKVYKIPLHLLCMMIFKLELPLTANLNDLFRDWVLPHTSIYWWNASTHIFYAHLGQRSDVMVKCNLRLSMHKDNPWWCNAFETTWHSQIDFKGKLFLWRVMSGSLPLATILRERMVTDGKCARCGQKQETFKHVFWYCPIINEWWHQLLKLFLCIDNKLNRFNITLQITCKRTHLDVRTNPIFDALGNLGYSKCCSISCIYLISF